MISVRTALLLTSRMLTQTVAPHRGLHVSNMVFLPFSMLSNEALCEVYNNILEYALGRRGGGVIKRRTICVL